MFVDIIFRRNNVTKAATLAWPGNDVPKFQNNPENLKKLDALVLSLKDCVMEKYFEAPEIRLHIMSTLAERRRHIKKGADYENVRFSFILCI